MEEETKVTYEDIYNEFNIDIPFEKLIEVGVLIPEELRKLVLKGYLDIVESKEYDITFHEYASSIFLLGLMTASEIQEDV